MTAPNLQVRPQRVAFHPRQIARLLCVALTQVGWLDQDAQDEALSGDHLPAFELVAPDGRRFLVTVEEV